MVFAYAFWPIYCFSGNAVALCMKSLTMMSDMASSKVKSVCCINNDDLDVKFNTVQSWPT